ncbi:MAG TPA: HipA domain-containing protein [Polyangiales bacterium]
MTRAIYVYADWEGLPTASRLATVRTNKRSAGGELFELEFDPAALEKPALTGVALDPRLGAFAGRQYPARGRDTFGLLTDASPDRWGRLLMRRRHERERRAGTIAKNARLVESDYLLGVHDAFRVGALRFRTDPGGPYLDDRHGVAAPPFVQLRELEAASLAIERDEDNTASGADDWLRMLIAPGGSLGGARPKASVVDTQQQLWIAKFPSLNDDHDVGAWEMLVHSLARGAGLSVSDALARRYASKRHTFLIKRFDRTPTGTRIHFASAMTLTGRSDGDDASTGASYLELARVLIEHGANPSADLRELWTRIVFNMLVSNSDDHLRNHGFLLVPRKGWRLSPAYDMNPVPDAHGLKLNISEADNALDLDLAREVAPYFRVKPRASNEIIERCRSVVRQWPKLAKHLGISAREQARMAPAFSRSASHARSPAR